MGKAKIFKKIGKITAFVLAILIILLVSYLVYIKVSVYRLDDNLELDIIQNTDSSIDHNDELSIVTYNIGMGIYSNDFGFFMDGGTSGKAFSKESVQSNTQDVLNVLQELNPDLLLIEETAVNCTCNYHINQLEELKKTFSSYDVVYAQNWDSPYFAYPFFDQFGKQIAGLTTLSKYQITSSTRYSLPLEESFTNFVDLDRCYTKSVLPVDDGHELILYCIHASAYTSDPNIANNQIQLLIADMQTEYNKGNYVIAGGDWNKTIDGDPEELYGISTEEYGWLAPLDKSLIPSCFYITSGIREEDAEPIPSVRNADGPYNAETQAQGNIDGFIVSDNLYVSEAYVVDTGFAYSDHNPVYVKFTFATNERLTEEQ